MSSSKSSSNKNRERNQALEDAIGESKRTNLISRIGAGLRNSIDAEDVYQDVLEDYIEAYDLGTAIESISSWLVTVAQNKVVDRFRRKKTHDSYQESLRLDTSEETNSIDGPDEESWRQNLRRELVAALEALPNDLRMVFIAHELEGKSFEEISVETGVKVNTLLSRKHKAVLELREMLKEIYDDIE